MRKMRLKLPKSRDFCKEAKILAKNLELLKSLKNLLSRHRLWQPNRQFDERAAAKEPTELFTKNTGLC